MENQVISEIKRILRAVRILSPSSFSFAGRVIDQAAAQPLASVPVQTDNPLVALLTNYLYFYCYCQTYNGDLPAERPTVAPDPNFLQTLSAANAASERWEPGWQVAQILQSGQVVAQKGGVSRNLWAGEFINLDGPGMPLRLGATIRVFFPKESITVQPGFYMAFSETLIEEANDYSLVRFYWNIEAKGAAELTAQITSSLNRFLLPYRFKCLTMPDYYDRMDAAVLYVSKRFYRITAELLKAVHQQMKKQLAPQTPLFAKRLARGLGLAEDPGLQDSFGTHRCRVLAEGILHAYHQGAKSEPARLQAVVKRFRHYGINPERPYLNSGSPDIYTFPNSQA